MKTLIQNWKTTSAGLTLIIGSIVHLIFAVRGGTANEGVWTASLTAILGGLGLMFAGDSAVTEKKIAPIAAAVDKINKEGSDPDTAMLSKPDETKTP